MEIEIPFLPGVTIDVPFLKDKKDRGRAALRERRRALRRAERATRTVADRVAKLEKQAAADWERAAAATREGRAEEARNALGAYRASKALATQLDAKLQSYRRLLAKVEAAGTDAELASALSAVTSTAGVDGTRLDEALAQANELVAAADATGEAWERLRADAAKEDAAAGAVPAVDELEKTLQAEVAAQIKGPIPLESLVKEN